MKNETKLNRMIRKIVKEELAKIREESLPPSPENFEDPQWGMFDETEFESMHRQDANPDRSSALPGWFEPHSEELEPPFFGPRRRKKK